MPVGAVISRELRREVLANARKRNASVVDAVQRMYRASLDKAVKRGAITAESAPGIAKRIDEAIRKELSLRA